MKFIASPKKLQQAIEAVQVKGKSLTAKGFGSSSMGDYIFLRLEGNELTVCNGSAIFLAKVTLTVVGNENGEGILDASTMLPYLKNFKEAITFTSGDFFHIICGSKKASIPRVVNHPTMGAITRLLEMTSEVSFQEEPTELPQFGKHQYEGAFVISGGNFSDCMKSCELVKSGVYRIDFDKEKVHISSQQTIQNRYMETIVPNHVLGEAATLEYTGPLHNFFDKDSNLIFFVKDEFPLLIVAEDRLILKAPQTGE